MKNKILSIALFLSNVAVASPIVGPVTYDSATSIVTIPYDGNFFNVKIKLRGVEVLRLNGDPILNYNFNRSTGQFRIKELVIDGSSKFENLVVKFTDYDLISQEAINLPTPTNTLAGKNSLIDGEYQCFYLLLGDVWLSEYRGNYQITLDPLGMYVKTRKFGEIEKYATISTYRRDANAWLFNYPSTSILGSGISIDLGQSTFKVVISEGLNGVACRKIELTPSPAPVTPIVPTTPVTPPTQPADGG